MRPKNNRKKIVVNALLILFVCLPVDTALAERIASEQTETNKPGRRPQIIQTAPETKVPEAKSEVLLYFASPDYIGHNGFLVAQGGYSNKDRTPANPTNPVMFAKNIIQALISGPDDGLMRTLPQDTKLRALYVTDDGTAYADFSVALKDNHPGGVMAELITIYSIVNSLVLNITGIDRVKILIEGHESLTLAGHIDLQNPFTPEMLLIR
jgi:spore germination protein GerM